jgi:hypothetical protein
MRISKQEIYNTCLERQEELVTNFRTKVNDMNQDLFSRDTIPSQEDHSPAEHIEILETMDQELRFLHAELNLLKSLDIESVRTIVEPGAVVVTDRRVFFISVSIEEIEVNGKKVFGISTHAPLYEKMHHLGKGESFEFNGTKYEIEDIY